MDSITNSAAQIELVPIGSIEIEKDYNVAGRDMDTSELEILMRANGFDPAFPITYVIRKVKGVDKMIVRAGHRRMKAAKKAELTHIYAIKKDMDSTQEIVDLDSSNSGKSLTQFQKGLIYKRLVDGNVKTAKVGDEIREPMTQKQVAALVGRTASFVCQCVLIAEAPSEVRELMEYGSVSGGAYEYARKILKTDVEKIIAVIKSASVDAIASGKMATDKHVKEAIAKLPPAEVETGAHAINLNMPPAIPTPASISVVTKVDKVPAPAKSFADIGTVSPQVALAAKDESEPDHDKEDDAFDRALSESKKPDVDIVIDSELDDEDLKGNGITETEEAAIIEEVQSDTPLHIHFREVIDLWQIDTFTSLPLADIEKLVHRLATTSMPA